MVAPLQKSFGCREILLTDTFFRLLLQLSDARSGHGYPHARYAAVTTRRRLVLKFREGRPKGPAS